MIFNRAGFSTLAAKDGEEAIRVYRETSGADRLCIPGFDLAEDERRRNIPCPSPNLPGGPRHRNQRLPPEVLEKRFAGLDVFGFVCKPDSPDDIIAKLREAVLNVGGLD